jgi:Outer membrane protein beta-barrel domain
MSCRMLWAGAIAGLLIATPLQAQSGVGITPYAGYMKFGNIVNGPLGSSLRNAGTIVYGAELGLGLSRNLALVGNLGYAKPNLEVGVPIVGGLSVGESSVLLYDAGLRLSFPLQSGGLPLTPFVQAGAGGIRQDVKVNPVKTHSTDFAYNLGAGVDLAVGPRLGVQLMAKDYIGKFDAKEATAINLDTKTSHNWAVSAGLRLGF